MIPCVYFRVRNHIIKYYWDTIRSLEMLKWRCYIRNTCAEVIPSPWCSEGPSVRAPPRINLRGRAYHLCRAAVRHHGEICLSHCYQIQLPVRHVIINKEKWVFTARHLPASGLTINCKSSDVPRCFIPREQPVQWVVHVSIRLHSLVIKNWDVRGERILEMLGRIHQFGFAGEAIGNT